MPEEPAPTEIPKVSPKEALAFFRGKGIARSFAWQDILKAQHDYWFTVAKMTSRSLLEDVHAILAEGIESGIAPREMAKQLKQRLQEAGWWGKQMQTDPLTGERKPVQLGSDRRVRVIIDTNLRTSYAAGRHARQQRVKNALPIKVYKSRMDGRERQEHHDWHDTALPVDHPWWDTHTGPCDWGCRCSTVTMTKGQAARRGLDPTQEPKAFPTRKWTNKRTGETFEIERGIGAGWDYHPGKAQHDGLVPPALHRFSTEEPESLATANVVEMDLARNFVATFDLGEGGGIWRDATGWPLAISERWLKGFSEDNEKHLGRIAGALATPDEIRLVWVTCKDDRVVLMRRYILWNKSRATVVDVGQPGWRYAIARKANLAALAGGVRVWQL